MSVKPILFNAEMVKAILDGQKTQTRRVVKCKDGMQNLKDFSNIAARRFILASNAVYKAPCAPGDILWVRETWCENKNPNAQNFGGYEYRADYGGDMCQDLITWRPSIHMPKEAARIFLRVKDVQVDRLRNMGYSDLADEGFTSWEAFVRLWDSTIKPEDRNMYGWNANPWVYAIKFERYEKPEVFL